MPAYIIAEIEVTDPERYDEYRKLVPATLAAYGGRFVVRGGAAERLEGTQDPARIVIIEFDSVEQAKRWWSSEEYREAKALRQEAAEGRMIVVEGV